jgi:predicted PurR-regulated permease PerM
MDEPGRSAADRQAIDARPAETGPALSADAAHAQAATASIDQGSIQLPRPPFVDPSSPVKSPRVAPLSPRVAILLIATLVVGALLWMTSDAVRPFVVGLLLVYLLDPPVRWLVGRGVRRTIAILLVYTIGILLLIELVNLTITPLVDEIARFLQDLPSLAASLQEQIQRLSELYARLQIPNAVRDWVDGVLQSIGQSGNAPVVDITAIFPIVTSATGILGAVFGYLLLPVWVFYLLNDRVALAVEFDRSLPPTWRFDAWAVIRIVRRLLGQWVRAQLVLGLTVGVFTFIGLLLLSRFVDPVFGRYAVLLSVTAGILELLPIIGPIISAIPAVLLAATAGIEPMIAALVLYTVVQQVENNLLVPKIQGDAIQMHPALVMFAIVIGGALAGLLGAILALPVTAAGRDVVRYLFRRASPDASVAVAASIAGLGLEDHLGILEGTDA